MLTSLKNKLSRKRETSKAAERRISQANLGSNNPYLDTSSSFTAPLGAAPANNDAPPPAYSPVDAGGPSQPRFLGVPRRDASPARSISSITSAEDKYAFLSTFDTVFVIDDSGSMAGRSWREVRDALSTIAPICTSRDPDGIDIYFLNHRSAASGSGTKAPGGYYHVRDAAQVQRLFESVRPGGATPTGARLHSILKPYVGSLTKHNMDATKPVNIIVITDGCPTDDPESIIIHHAKKLDKLDAPPHQLGIQFFQVGSEREATTALRRLDDDLEDEGIRDMVDTATWNSMDLDNAKSLTADGILKVVLGAVHRRWDRMSARNSTESRRR